MAQYNPFEYVKHRLDNWGRWCQQSEAGALGYPRQSTFVRMGVPTGRSTDSSVPISSIDASEVDDAVKSLQFTQSQLHKVLILTYAKGLPRYRVAREMSRAESTVSANLVAAYGVLDRLLGDMDAIKQKRAQDAKRSFTA